MGYLCLSYKQTLVLCGTFKCFNLLIFVIDEYDIERHDVFVKKLDSTDAAAQANHLVNNKYIDITYEEGDQHLSGSNKHMPNIVLHR